jgi:nitroreductase
MNTISREQLLERLNWRYATKQFDPDRAIRPADWSALEESLRLTPSSYGLQPWRFVVVTDPEVRKQLLPAAFEQRQVVDASHLVVFAVKAEITERDVDEYLDAMAEVRGVERESLKAFRDSMVGAIIERMDQSARREWATQQAFIALGNFLTSSALLGIDACPMGGFVPAEFDRILGLDQLGLHAVVIAAAGYRAPSDKYSRLNKVRLPKEQVLIEV